MKNIVLLIISVLFFACPEDSSTKTDNLPDISDDVSNAWYDFQNGYFSVSEQAFSTLISENSADDYPYDVADAKLGLAWSILMQDQADTNLDTLLSYISPAHEHFSLRTTATLAEAMIYSLQGNYGQTLDKCYTILNNNHNFTFAFYPEITWEDLYIIMAEIHFANENYPMAAGECESAKPGYYTFNPNSESFVQDVANAIQELSCYFSLSIDSDYQTLLACFN